MTTLLLALAMATTAVDDPVPGDPEYLPAIGESAVLHNYDSETKRVAPRVESWTNTTAMVRFFEAFLSEANVRELEKASRDADPKALKALYDKRYDELTKGPIERKELLFLPDLTPVRVHGLGMFFTKQDSPLFRYLAIPNAVLVEATVGPMKGRFFWVGRHNVRVLGAKLPPLPEPDKASPSPGFEKIPQLSKPDDVVPDIKPDVASPLSGRGRGQGSGFR